MLFNLDDDEAENKSDPLAFYKVAKNLRPACNFDENKVSKCYKIVLCLFKQNLTIIIKENMSLISFMYISFC